MSNPVRVMRFTVPAAPESAPIKDGCGLPLGCSLMPMVRLPSNDPRYSVPDAQDIPRCESCGAYINAYCRLDVHSWRCGLCATVNPSPSRYRQQQNRHLELTRQTVDAVVSSVPRGVPGNINEGPALAFVAIVDVSCDEDTLQLFKDGLEAFLEGLPESCGFAMLSVDECVGVWDMRAETPHCYHLPVEEEGLQVSLEELMPHKSFAVPLFTHKQNAVAAIQALQPSSATNPHLRPKLQQGQEGGLRCVGSALQAVIEWSAQDKDIVCSRAMLLLSGPPNHGEGSLAGPSRDPGWYGRQSSICSDSNVCVDLYAISPGRSIGCMAMLPLIRATGGQLMVYSSIEDCTLPQDLYRQAQRDQGYQGLLRIRCSPGFEVDTGFGCLREDDTYEQLYHITCCDAASSFSFDFKYTSASGLNSDPDVYPTVQAAYAYTCVVPSPNGDGSYDVQRRIRIETSRLDVGRFSYEIMPTARPDEVVGLVCHKIIAAVEEHGLQEARSLLQDWLVVLCSKYNIAISRGKGSRSIDSTFAKMPSLATIPTLVFAILRSPLLCPAIASMDLGARLRQALTRFHPSTALVLACPTMTGWASLDDSEPVALPLIEESVFGSAHTILILDALVDVTVFYTHGAREIHFPPPASSGIASYIKKLQSDRAVVPKVRYIRQGDQGTDEFLAWMIENPIVGADESHWAGASALGLQGFVDFIREESMALLEDGAV